MDFLRARAKSNCAAAAKPSAGESPRDYFKSRGCVQRAARCRPDAFCGLHSRSVEQSIIFGGNQMVLYFSGTGNSAYAAKRIAAKLGDEATDQFGRLRARDYTGMRAERRCARKNSARQRLASLAAGARRSVRSAISAWKAAGRFGARTAPTVWPASAAVRARRSNTDRKPWGRSGMSAQRNCERCGALYSAGKAE